MYISLLVILRIAGKRSLSQVTTFDLILTLIISEAILEEPLRKERVDAPDILHAARQSLGISRLDQLDYAVVEAGGGITVVPKRTGRKRRRPS